MTQSSDTEKERLARRMFEEVWNDGNLDEIQSIVSSDYVEYIRNPPERIEGRHRVAEVITAMHDPAPRWRRCVDQIAVNDDLIILRYLVTDQETGGTDPGFMVFRVDGDRLVAGIDIVDTGEILTEVFELILESET